MSVCRVYWGSHGCALERGHDGDHACDCDVEPYVGPETNFYGEDAPPRVVAVWEPRREDDTGFCPGAWL